MTFIEEVGASVGPILGVFVLAGLAALPDADRPAPSCAASDRRPTRTPAASTRAPIPRAGGLAIAAAFLLVAGRFVLLNERTRWVPTPLTLESSDFLALFLGGAAAAPSARSTTCSISGRAGSSTGQVGLALIAVALGIGITVVNNPFGDGASSGSASRSRSGSRSSGSSG